MNDRLLPFALASLALIAIPGPNLVYIVTRSATQGLRGGVASALGVEAGTLVHIAAAGLGLAAIVAASPVVFTVVKYAGVAYLIYLGVQALRHPPSLSGQESSPAKPWRLFLDGAIVNVLNPKVALFFLAFLPQFVRSGSEMPLFGALFFGLALAADLGYCLAAKAISPWLRAAKVGRGWFAGIYFGLGLLAAVGTFG